MKRILTTLALLLSLGLVLGASPAQAQVGFKVGPRLGIDASEDVSGESGEIFLGADARISSAALPIVINPTFDWYFVDDPLSFWSVSANALYPIGIDNAVFTPYFGGGVGLYNASIDGGDSSTDFGLNAIFGAQFLDAAPVTPFVEAQYSPVFSDPENRNLFSVKGGLLVGI
jgi:hypothetical protein